MVLQALGAATFRTAVSRASFSTRARRSPRQRLVVRAEIKKIQTPEGTTCDTDELSVACADVRFKDPPVFDRGATKTGIMHIGVGGFHRSHQLVRVV